MTEAKNASIAVAHAFEHHLKQLRDDNDSIQVRDPALSSYLHALIQ
jgi:hypothetical protein